MGQTAEELRAELADHRDALGQDLEAIGDRVSPGRIVERRRAAVGQSMTRVRERVMGVADDKTSAVGRAAGSVGDRASGAASSIGTAASSVADTITSAPDTIRERTEGAPLAAGLVAFGAGFLVSSLLPASSTEQRAAARVQPALESAASELGSAGQQVAQDLAAEAKDAAQDLTASAQEAAQGIKDQAADVAQAHTEDAKAAVHDVQQQAAK